MEDNHIYYTLLHQLALRAKWICRPNPAVAALVVKNRKIISWGYTQPIGGHHAEVEALLGLPPSRTAGAHLYVTLMPCSFANKTPACTDRISRSGIKHVHVAGFDNDPRMWDEKNPCPNPRSVALLRQAGITLHYDCPVEVAEKLFFLNWEYFKRNATHLPTLTLKYAMTLDGKIAGPPRSRGTEGEGEFRGEVRITGEKIEAETHSERAQHDAILVGGNTLRNDNPRLNVRMEEMIPELPSFCLGDLPSGEENSGARQFVAERMAPSVRQTRPFSDLFSRIIQPIPMIMTRTPHSPSRYLMKKKTFPHPLFLVPAEMGERFSSQRSVLFTGEGRSRRLIKQGHCGGKEENTWLYRGSPFGKEFWKALQQEFAITSIFLEGGAALQTYLWETGLIDRIHVYISPRIFRRGEGALSPFTPHHPIEIAPPLLWDLWQTRVAVWGRDIKVSGFVNRTLSQKLWKELFPVR